MTETEARNAIIEQVRQYCRQYVKCRERPEQSRLNYAGRVFDEEEMGNLADCMLDFWLTQGRYTNEFEEGLAEFLGVKFCSFVNSGSSANLLAFMALTSPLLKERRIARGDEVITVAACFPTTVSPIIQYGAVPVFVDVRIPQYNIDISALEGALSEKTKAIMIAHTLGNPFDVQAVKDFCRQHNLWLIEDNCDALGSRVVLDGISRCTGSVGDIGTSSFYPPHHMTTGEGGAVYTSDPLLHKIIRSMRDWGRDCVCASGQDNFCGHRFDRQYGELPLGYDHKYVYSHFGYNLKATDLQAAIGCAQLKKLPSFIDDRKKHFQILKEGLLPLEEDLILPEALPKSEPSWFGFLITCREGLNRNLLTRYLEENRIQTRTLFSGNITKHPCYLALGANCGRIAGSLENTDCILNNSFWVGVYPGLSEEDLRYMINMIKQGVKIQTVGAKGECDE